MNKLRLDDKMYIFELFLLFGICLFTMLQNTAMVSGLFQLTFYLLVLIMLMQLWISPRLNKLHLLAFVTIILSFLHVTIQADVLSFGYYKKMIMFSCTVLMLPIVNGTNVPKRMVNWMLGINLLIASLYAFMYFVVGIRGHVDVYLTLNFSNPNATAMFLLHSILYCAIAFYYFRQWFLRVLSVVLFVALMFINEKTGSRSTYLAMAAFGAFALVNIVLKKRIQISKKISFVLVLLPLIIAIVYLVAFQTGLIERFFSFMVKRGKTLDARVQVWQEALTYFAGSPIIGAYNTMSGGTGMSQMHNTHLDVLASYGAVPFALFIAILHQGVGMVLPKANTNFARMCMFAFYAILLQGSFEAALVSGGTGLYILSFGFLLLAKYNVGDIAAGAEGTEVQPERTRRLR